MNKAIETKIEAVKNAYPSIFTKDDVVKLLTDLDGELNLDVDAETLEKTLNSYSEVFKMNLISELQDNVSDYVDLDDVSFEVYNGNEIQIENSSVDVDKSSLSNIISNVIENSISEFVETV